VLRVLRSLERRVAAIDRHLRRRAKRRRGEALTLLVQLDWRLGDEVMALPVYEALRRAHAGDHIAVRVRHPALLAGSPFVDAINPLSLVPDRIVEIKGEVPGEARRTTLARLAGVSLDDLVPRVHLSHGELTEPAFAELDDLPRPRVALHPTATQPCKRWGRARWRDVAEELIRRGFGVVEVGRGHEPLGVGLSLVDRTDVRALARTLAQVDVVAGDDSGPLHLALAVGKPIVGLFGATDHELLFAPGARLEVVSGATDCQHCWPQRRLAYPSGVCPLEEHLCMTTIESRRVVEAIERAAANRAGR